MRGAADVGRTDSVELVIKCISPVRLSPFPTLRPQHGSRGCRGDRGQEASVRHLGEHGERGESHGLHRRAREDPGALLFTLEKQLIIK